MSDSQAEVSSQASRGHSALLAAIHHLEAALASPAPGREREWAGHVAEDLGSVCRALAAHARAVEAPDGLYEQLEEAMPQAATRLRYLRETNRSVADRAELLRREVERIMVGEGSAFMAIRDHAAGLMTALRHQQSRELDLIFEAFERDLGEP